MKLKLLLLGIILATIIPLKFTGFLTETTPIENSYPMEIYFCPNDNCSEKLSHIIELSNESVDCAFYDLDLENVIYSLKNENYRLVIDKENTENLSSLEYVANYGTYQLTHNKFCIIDGKIITTGSFNPTDRGTNYNNNNFIIIYSEYLAQNYQQEFNELYNKQFGKGSPVKYPEIIYNSKKIENYFCPEDNCQQQVISELQNAEYNIYFMTFSFTDDDIGDLLIQKHNQGVGIKGIFEKFQNSQYSEYKKLEENNIGVIFDNNKYNMHHKVFIIDEKIVITGSYNPTKAANEKNDENIIIIHDENAAKEFLDEFNRLWITN